jgi:fibrillarin-like rRNA methylase
MKNNLNKIAQELHMEYVILQGMTDEAMAKANLYKRIGSQQPDRYDEMVEKIDLLLKDLAKYKKTHSKLKKKWLTAKKKYGEA